MKFSFHKHFAIFILFCFFRSYADTRLLDSLRHVLETTSSDTIKVNCWNTISMIHSNEGRYSLAEKAGIEALDLANRVNFKKGIGNAYYQIGISYSKQAKYDLAMQWYLKALSEYEKAGNKRGLGFTYLLIGVIDYYLHNNDKAEVNYNKALNYFDEINDNSGKANVTVNLAYLYEEKGDLEKAIGFAEKAYKLFEGGKSYHGMAVCKTCIANCYTALYNKNDTTGNKDIADEYLRRAARAHSENLSIYKSMKMPIEITIEYTGLFDIYFGSSWKNKDIAKQYLDSASAIVDTENDPRHAMAVYESYYRWYLYKGDSLKAFTNYLKYTNYKDKVFSAEKAEKLENMAVELAELEKQKEIDLLTKDKEKKGLILWGVGLMAVLAIAFSILFFIRYRDKKSANKELTQQKKIIEDKNKEITDSIHYAKRIQSTLLPNEKYIDKVLKKRGS